MLSVGWLMSWKTFPSTYMEPHVFIGCGDAIVLLVADFPRSTATFHGRPTLRTWFAISAIKMVG